MDSGALGQAVELHKELAGQVHDLWTFCQLVALAVVGYVYRGDQPPSRSTRWVLLISFLVFALANGVASHEKQASVLLAANAICHQAVAAQNTDEVWCQLHDASLWSVAGFELGMAVAVALVILAPDYIKPRRRS